MRARYVQGVRLMWGALDCGYVIREGIMMWRRRRERVRDFAPVHLAGRAALGHPSIAKDVTMSQMSRVELDPPKWTRLLLLSYRLLELYFMPVSLHMTIANFLLRRIWQGEPPTHL